MKRATNQQPRGITWKAFNHLEDEDFVDDIALLSHSQKDMQEKTRCVKTTARSIGLKISHSRSKVMKINTKSNSDVLIEGKSVENVTDFKYLGNYLTADGNTSREISARIVMASTAFYKLKNIWKSNRIMKDAKLKLYTSHVRSVLLYASETRRTNQRIESKLRGFEGRCLRRILGIRWEHRVTNKEIFERTGIRPIVEEVKKRRWRWLGHVLRMSKSRHPLIALTWNPKGSRRSLYSNGCLRCNLGLPVQLSSNLQHYDEDLECQTVRPHLLAGDMYITNIYFPPPTPSPLKSINTHDHLIVGDFTKLGVCRHGRSGTGARGPDDRKPADLDKQVR
ncbi:hypothetical protein ElyMa_004691200 [Elysia marginata]|uniref:DUF6451 domain-containing protein n=1 Tax=Elysia marginata TaxID=1093978 RepID=A0AAV4IAU3_9GAST|nr:hypothetical protein ElyMa_004691200 [Elysia marginata]